MGYALTGEVKTKEQAEELSKAIVKVLEEDLEMDIHPWISTNIDEHTYPPKDIDHAVYISYNNPDRDLHKFYWNIVQTITRELSTRMFYDTEEIDPHEDDITWNIDFKNAGVMYRMVGKVVNRKHNKNLQKYKELFDNNIKPIIT